MVIPLISVISVLYMCGICGIINFNNQPVSEAPILQMMKSQKHRGPDDEGVFIEDNVGLGFVRLSILDLSPAGHQPMFSHDQRYVVVFNGEIFNYIELRNELSSKGYSFNTGTDTEVLLASFKHWGEDCLHRFNGMWAFVVYDRVEKRIFASRDRYGIKPFYYYVTDEFFAFASEIPPLLSLLSGKPTPDNQSIFDYLVFNRTDQTERTFFNEIKKLQHGHKFTIKGSQITIEKWYDLEERVSQTTPFANAEEYKNLFHDSVKLRLRSDVPVGVCFSGGLDSSAIVSAIVKEHNQKDLNTFSAVYGFGIKGDESFFIQQYSEEVKKMHYTVPDADTLFADIQSFVKVHGEPIPSTGPYAQFRVMELAQKHVVVTLDGQGADEELAGYHYFFGFYFKDLFKRFKWGRLANEMYHYYKNHRSLYGIKTFLYFLLPVSLRSKARESEKGYLNAAFISKYSLSNSIAGQLYNSDSLNAALLNHFTYKLEHLLKWEDRNSMNFSIEARVPFLDYRLVEKTLALSADKVIKKGMTKHILREAMKGLVPEPIRMRKDKTGFLTPEDDWFRTSKFKQFITEILQSDSFRLRNIVNASIAMNLYNQHINGKINISKEIWKWLHLELWFREFID